MALADPAGQAYPAVQLPHEAAPTELNWPAAHMTAVALGDPAGHAYPAVQLATQALLRATSELHRPAAHDAHVPAPLVLNWPAGQATAVALVDPAGQAYPAGHCPEQPAVAMKGLLPNRPGAH